MKNYLMSLYFLILPACGFTPLYEQDEQVNQTLNSIYIEPIDGVPGVKLRNAIENDLFKNAVRGRGETYYSLQVKLTSSETSMAIRSDDVATLIKATYTAKIKLKQKSSSKILLEDSFSISTSRNVLSNPYGTIVSQEAGKDRSINLLANDIAERLTIYFKNQNKKNL
jgi:LPS-assembly lipoprotein